MAETIFEKILRREIPAAIVYEDESVLAFRDIQPQAPIHVLVIPKTKFLNFLEVPDQSDVVLAGLMRGVAATARHLGLEADGYRVVFNNGRQAQQSVPYIHAHILAGRDLGWPPG